MEIDDPIKKLNDCPHCGSTAGYYKRVYVSGWINDKRDFNHDPDNYELYDHLKWGRESKHYRCRDCHKIIKPKI